MSRASALYVGEVMHQRMPPLGYRFQYGGFSLLVDLDDAEADFPKLRWLSHNRFNLLSFYDKDHGARDGQALRPWLVRVLNEAGLSFPLGRVLINAYPRILGYQFNPLTVWYVEDSSGEICAILCEVSNTFGQAHHYLMHENGSPLRFPFRAQADKVFHVSPFIGMGMRYHFRFSPPFERLSVAIRETERDKPDEPILLVATHIAKRMPLTDAALLAQCLRIPLLTFKVIVLIHWHALKIFLRGGRLLPSPPSPPQEVSVCPPNTSNP